MPLHHELKGYIKYEEANTEWYHETHRFGVGAYSPYLAGIARLQSPTTPIIHHLTFGHMTPNSQMRSKINILLCVWVYTLHPSGIQLYTILFLRGGGSDPGICFGGGI